LADDDFDIQRLAAYLHIDPAQVARLADRGRLPGRKVAGQWRFAPADIHHWLEDRIGLSTDEELQQMEGALRRPPGASAEAELSIAKLLPFEAIAIPLAARTRGSVISSMCELAAQTGWLWPTPSGRARTCAQPPSTTAWLCSTRDARCRIFSARDYWLSGGPTGGFRSAAPAAR